MYRTFFVFLKCTIQGGPKVDVLLIAFLYLWLKFWEGIDKYWIVPVRNLFYFHHCVKGVCSSFGCSNEGLQEFRCSKMALQHFGCSKGGVQRQ